MFKININTEGENNEYKKRLKQNNFLHDETVKPSTIMHNVYAVYQSFAMLARMQLDVFTPLKDGPMEAKTLATAS